MSKKKVEEVPVFANNCFVIVDDISTREYLCRTLEEYGYGRLPFYSDFDNLICAVQSGTYMTCVSSDVNFEMSTHINCGNDIDKFLTLAKERYAVL